jgi:hypothetical protein
MYVKTVEDLYTTLIRFILIPSKMSVVDVMLYTLDTLQQEKETNGDWNLSKD